MTSTADRLKFAGFTLVIALAVALAYTTLHEGGHALAGLVFGGRIGEFDVNPFTLGAHVNIDGEFNRSQNAVINISGAGLPLLVWLGLILALPRKGSPLVQWTKFIASAGTLCFLLAWVFIPFFYLKNSAPAGDDVNKFIANSELPPVAVVFCALAFFMVGWLLFAQRSVGVRTAWRVLFNSAVNPVAAWRWGLAGVVIIASLVGAGLLVASTLGSGLTQPPKNFDIAATVDISVHDMHEETIALFNLTKAGDAAIFLGVTGIDISYVDVTLVPLQGGPVLLMHGEDFSSNSSDSQVQVRLPAGEYKIVLNSRKSSGILKVYFHIP